MNTIEPVEIERAAQLLRAGALVAFPTETVYGLGADARNADAVRRIFDVKGRPAEHPVIVHLAGADLVPHWAREASPGALALADAFWPGPLTLILPRAENVLDVVTGGQDSVGLRVPAHPIAHALLTRVLELGGDGIAAPSANRFGRISATNARHVGEEFGSAIALVLDGGASRHGIESTIVDFTRGEAVLLRPGAITIESLRRVLGTALRVASAHSPRVSGAMASHYAPRTAARLVAQEVLARELSAAGTSRAGIAVLARTVARPADFDGVWIAAPESSVTYARDLYANLRTLDSSGAAEIWIESPPDSADWLAVNDRLRKATHRG
jgi:L-threonylcarbamoyladenylate synthase